MSGCDIKSCKASFVIHSKVTFHKLPCNHALREAWLDSIGQENLTTRSRKSVIVCSQHFEPTCFYYAGTSNRRMLKRNSIPSIFATAERKSNSEEKRVETEPGSTVPQVNRNCSSTSSEGYKKKKKYHMVNAKHVGQCQTNFKSVTGAQKRWVVAMQEIKKQKAKMHVWNKKNVWLEGYVKTLKHLIGQVRQHIRNKPDSLIDNNK